MEKPRHKKETRIPSWAISFISGGTAGTIAKTSIAPLERVKILFQIRSKHYPYKGVLSTLSSIVEKEGVTALWKGNNATILRIFPYAAIQFMTFEYIRKFVQLDEKASGIVPTLINLTAGSMAGGMSVICTYPLDLVRVRLAVAVREKHYNGVYDCIRGILQKEGVIGLYKGISPTLLGIMPYAGTNFAAYEFLKKLSASILDRDLYELPIYAKLLSGGFAGAIGQTVAYPLDVVRRQMQTAGYTEGHGAVHKSTGDAIKTILAKEGWRGLFRGLSINYLRVGPQVALSFTTYETVKKYLETL